MTTLRNPKTGGQWDMPRDARRYADRVTRATDAKPCQHGHFDCALWEGGPCMNEWLSRLEDSEIAERERVIADAAARAAIAALRAIADPNKLDASSSPLPDNLARLALSWLAARPEFENARAVLRLYDRRAS